jgi:sulfur carrier protein
MRIEVNGEVREVAPVLTVSELLGTLGVGNDPVAVERNGEIVARAEHPHVRLCDGDVLEVVHFVGGG